MMGKRLWLTALIGFLGLGALVGCESTGPQFGRVNLYLTDAPLANVASATVWISRASLIPGDDGGGFTITDTPQEYDLLQLQNGATALLGSANIPVGDYAQLRLVVDSARVTLEAGSTFSDGSSAKSLLVPSGMQTGIKVVFAPPVHVEPGVTNILVDFDASQSFVFLGPPSAPNDVLFRPAIRASVM